MSLLVLSFMMLTCLYQIPFLINFPLTCYITSLRFLDVLEMIQLQSKLYILNRIKSNWGKKKGQSFEVKPHGKNI